MGHQQPGSKKIDQKEEQKTFETAGDILKRARESAGFPLQELSKTLCISEHYLRAIEENDYASLPAPVYTLGFIRSYALHLSLDPVPLITSAQLGLTQDSEQSNFQFKKATPENQIPRKSIVYISAICALTVLAGWNYYAIDHTPTQSNLAGTSLTPQDQTSVSAVITQDDLNINSDKVSPAEGLQNTPETQKEQSVFAEEVLPVETQEQIQLSRGNTSAHLPENVRLSDFRVKLGEPLIVQAKRRSWIEVRTQDGRVLVSRILDEGETRRISGQPGLILSTGNAGGITLSTSDQQTAPLGTEGQVLRDIELHVAGND